MVLPKINVNYNTRNTINAILNGNSYNINSYQASCILKQFFKTSLLRLRTSFKLKFMKDCNAIKVYPNKIESVTKPLNLRYNQATKLKEIMTRNIINNLYKELTERNRAMNRNRQDLREYFQTASVNKIYACWYIEKEFAAEKTIIHYKLKTVWLIKK